MCHIGSVKDEVEGEGPRLGPVFVLRADEFLGAQGERIFLLVGRVRDGVRFSAQGGSPEEPEMAEATAARGQYGVGPGGGVEIGTYIPRTATFLPGPVLERRRGLKVVMPAHSIGAANSVGMLSGILNVKYSCARIWLA